MRRFFVDLILSVCGSALALGSGYVLMFAAPLELMFGLSALFALAVPFLGLVTIAVWGLFKGRIGAALGPVALLCAAPLISSFLLSRDLAAIDAQRVDLSPPTANYANVVIGRKGVTCDSVCLQILARTQLNVTIGSTTYESTVGSGCLRNSLANSMLDFIEHGYADICAMESELVKTEAFTIREIEVSRQNRYNILPPTFRGYVYEAYETRNGTDVLRGRWITGGIESRLPKAFLYPMELFGSHTGVSAGPKVDRYEFYSAALGINIVDDPVPGRSDARVLLDRLQRLPPALLRSKRVAELAETLRRKTVILDSFDSAMATKGDEAFHHIAIAVAELKKLPSAETDFASATIETLVKSADPRIVGAALSSLIDLREKSFAQDAVIDLTTNPMSAEAETVLAEPLMRAVLLVHSPSEELLDRIKASFMSDTSLRALQRWLMMRIVAWQGREAIVQMIFDLPSPIFEESVQAAQVEGRSAIPLGYASSGWTFPECGMLLKRAVDAPPEILLGYLESILTQCKDRWSNDTISNDAHNRLRAKLAQLEASQSYDQQTIENIKTALEQVGAHIKR